MGTFYNIKRLRSYILIILIIVSFFVVVPIKNGLGAFIDKKVEVLTSEISDNLGLTISYKSLSPSILTNFKLKGVEIVDEKGVSVLDIDVIKINYSIFKLLKKDLQNGIKSVLIDGINLNVNEVLKIASYFKSENKKEKNKITFEDVKNNIPKNIKLKNLNFNFENETLDFVYNVKNISLVNKIENKTLEVDMKSSLSAFLKKAGRQVNSKLLITGAITDNFENSQLNIKISDIESGKVKINKLNFHASYSNDIIEVHTIQVTNPISLGVAYNIASNELTAQINTDDITLESLFASSPKAIKIENIKDTLIGTNTKITCDFRDKEFDYYSESNIKLPETFSPGGVDIYIAFYGDEEKFNLSDFSIDSQKCLLDSNLTFVYDTVQLSGIFELPYLILPNGNSISTEIYFDPLDKGFVAFSPQLFIGGSSFTALQFKLIPEDESLDFDFEMSDYSHSEEGVPGVIKVEGSYLTKSKYFQTSVSLNTLYLDSVSNTFAEFLPKEKYQQILNMKNTLSPYVISGDAYISTDLKSISYNVPYVLLANTKKDNQVAMFAINGTDQSIQLNQLSFVYGKFGLQANALFDKNPDTSDIFFDANVTISSVPYHFYGTIMPEICTIVGDYGTNIELRFGDNSKIDGFVEIENLPVKVGESSCVISTYSKLNYNKIDGPKVVIERFEAEGARASVAMNPRVALSGSATKYGVQLDSISYTDFYSALEGGAELMIDMNSGILETATLGLNLQNPLTAEKVSVNGTVSNPEKLPMSGDTLLNDTYIDIQIQLNELSLNRFVQVQSDSNYLTGSVFASGTIAHPYVNIAIEDFSMYSGSSLVTANGAVLLEDRYLSLIGMNVGYGKYKFNSLQGEASLEDFSADFTCDFEMPFLRKYLETSLKLSVSNAIIPEGSFLPDTFTATVSSEAVGGSLIRKPFPMELSVFHTPEGTNIISSENIGLKGFLSSDGLLEMNWDNGEFLSTKLDGFISPDIFNIQLYDLYMDIDKAFKYIDLDKYIIVDKGSLTGEVVVTGSLINPEMDGHLLIAAPVCKLPFITPSKVSTREIQLNIVDNVIQIPSTILKAKSGERLELGFNIYLNRLSLDYIEGKVKSVGDDFFPGNLKTSYFTLESDVLVDLDLFIQNKIFEITGTVYGENTEMVSTLSSISNKVFNTQPKKAPKKYKYVTDIDVMLGIHSTIDFDPILRCVFVPNTKLNVAIDQTDGEYSFDGEFKLRSGDIAYLNRSFYIKSGAIKFEAEDFSNPLITIRAETRERDDKGDPVKIILDVENQHLLDFQPRFRSEPAKSEIEIQTLLGQIVMADSENAADFIFAAGDYALQSTFVRRIENKLRDLLNFDIFSIRTNVLQNTLNMGMSGNLTKENFSVGNFLDNTTVYIGKYLGSSLYLDAMLHITFEDSNFNDITEAGDIIFQPEIGLEMESPFANIRFNLAPDLNALIKNNQFVPSPSLTLSWDFAF